MSMVYKSGSTEHNCFFLADTYTGTNVKFFPNSVIGRPGMAPSGLTEIDYSKSDQKPVKLGNNTVVGANVVIYSDVIIGNSCLIGDGVIIRGDVVIGDNCVIGIGCKVGVHTTIGSRTKIMDLTNVASDAVIDDDVFIGTGVMMGNDNSLSRSSSWSPKGPCIKDWATIGLNASLLPGVTIGKDCIVGANSVVTKDVDDYTVVMGISAKKVRVLDKGERRC